MHDNIIGQAMSASNMITCSLNTLRLHIAIVVIYEEISDDSQTRMNPLADIFN